MFSSSFAVALTGLALGLLALGAFVWAWRREAANRFYRGLAHPPRREVLRDAALGGLLGFILSALLSLAIVAVSGNESPGASAVAQLLGPEIGVVCGAALGALFGRFRHRRLRSRYARAVAPPSAILLVPSRKR